MKSLSRQNGLLIGALSALTLGIAAFSPAGAQTHKPHTKISVNQAKAVALKKYPGTVAGRINLEDEDGKWQYAVNVRSGRTLREVMVDANTGKIASVEVTTKAEEAQEQKAEAAKAKKTRAANSAHKAR